MFSKPRTAEELAYARRLAAVRLTEGNTQEQVAEFIGVSVRTVQRWWREWLASGEASFPLRPGRGRPTKLQGAVTEQVLEWVEQEPQHLGFEDSRWTAPRLATLLQERLGVSVNHRYLNDWLRRHGITPQLPERCPRERDEVVVEGWKRHQWPRIKKKSATSVAPLLLRTNRASCSPPWFALRWRRGDKHPSCGNGAGTATRSLLPQC